MSGCNYDSTCSRCGGIMDCYSDSRPFDTVSGLCLACGFTLETITKLSSLEAVNECRQDLEMEPIPALRQPTPEWVKAGYEDF